MDYQIALSPNLEIIADEFVSAWNDEAKCRDVAKAELAESSAKTFMEPGTMAVFLGSVVGAFALDVLKDLIKEQVIKIIKDKMGKDSEPPETEIILIEQPDGTRLIFVKGIDE